jgi:hypothetical protein
MLAKMISCVNRLNIICGNFAIDNANRVAHNAGKCFKTRIQSGIRTRKNVVFFRPYKIVPWLVDDFSSSMGGVALSVMARRMALYMF